MGGTFKGWVPECYLDEVAPEPRATPSVWLAPGDVMRLAGFDSDDEPGAVVAEGETMTFVSLTHFGTCRVEWNGGRDFVARDPIPAGATIFMLVGDTDTISTSVADLCGSLVDEDPGELDVLAYHWCDGTAFVMRGGAFVEVTS